MTLRRRPQTATRTLTTDLVLALLAALVGTAWLSWFDASDGARPNDVIAVINESATVLGYSLPFVMLAVPAVLAALRRRGLRASSAGAVAAAAGASALAVSLAAQLRLVLELHYARGVRASVFAGDALTTFVVLFMVGITVAGLLTLRATTVRTATRTVLVLAIGVTGSLTAAFSTATAVNASISDTSCLAGGAVDKTFDVTAIDVDIPRQPLRRPRPEGQDVRAQLRARRDPRPRKRSRRCRSVSATTRSSRWPSAPTRVTASRSTSPTTPPAATMACTSTGWSSTRRPPATTSEPTRARQCRTVRRRTYRYAVPLDNRLEGAHYIHPGSRLPRRGRPRPVRCSRRRAAGFDLLGRHHCRQAARIRLGSHHQAGRRRRGLRQAQHHAHLCFPRGRADAPRDRQRQRADQRRRPVGRRRSSTPLPAPTGPGRSRSTTGPSRSATGC